MSEAPEFSKEAGSLTFGQKLKAMFCCGEADDEYESPRRSIQIGGPTNFRREDVNIAGLTEEEALEIRAKSRRDAQRMFHSLRPLQSSPSGTFAERPALQSPTLYDNHNEAHFTHPRPAPPTPGSSPAFSNSPTFSSSRLSPSPSGGPQRDAANRVSGFYGGEQINTGQMYGGGGGAQNNNHNSNYLTASGPGPVPTLRAPTSGKLGERVKAHSRKFSGPFSSRKALPIPPQQQQHQHQQETAELDVFRHFMSSGDTTTAASSKTQVTTTVLAAYDGSKASGDSFETEYDGRSDSGLGAGKGAGKDYRI